MPLITEQKVITVYTINNLDSDINAVIQSQAVDKWQVSSLIQSKSGILILFTRTVEVLPESVNNKEPEIKFFTMEDILRMEKEKEEKEKNMKDNFGHEMTFKGSFRKENYDPKMDCLK